MSNEFNIIKVLITVGRYSYNDNDNFESFEQLASSLRELNTMKLVDKINYDAREEIIYNVKRQIKKINSTLEKRRIDDGEQKPS